MGTCGVIVRVQANVVEDLLSSDSGTIVARCQSVVSRNARWHVGGTGCLVVPILQTITSCDRRNPAIDDCSVEEVVVSPDRRGLVGAELCQAVVVDTFGLVDVGSVGFETEVKRMANSSVLSSFNLDSEWLIHSNSGSCKESKDRTQARDIYYK